MTQPLAGAATDRRSFLALLGLGAVATAGGGLLTACSKEAGTTGAATNVDKVAAVLPRYKAIDLVKPDIAGIRPVADGFLKYPASLVDAITDRPGTSGKAIKSMTPWWGSSPPGLGNNSYLSSVNSELGIDVDPSTQDGNTYADKLNATLGARDVPDLLCVPSWEVSKIPRFSDAVKALFEDLTDYLAGDAAAAYPMLAALPTGAWGHSVWGGRLSAVPFPTDGPFPWALFYRKDLLDAAGLSYPKTIDELFDVGKKVTDPGKGIWAFNDIFDMVQMFYKAPGSETGWRRKADGTPEYKYEMPEYRAAVEFMVKVYKEGLVHPEIMATKGADSKKLFAGGKIVFMKDGVGAWKGMQADEQKVTPSFNMQPAPIFSATGGDPLVWGSDGPIFYTFVKKGLGKDRTQEVLRVLNFLAAPLGTKEFELREYGAEGKHFNRATGGPTKTDLAQKEIADQYTFLGGRPPAIIAPADVPRFIPDLLAYSNAMVKFLERNPWYGIKLEFPANYSKNLVPTEDKITDVLRGRRPLSDLDTIVKEWRDGGGNEARDFLAKALADNGR